MKKLERLLNLIAVLLHTSRPLTAVELREKVPGYPEGDAAFRRAFERDKDDLRELKVPIDLVSIPGTDPPAEGYRIPRDRYYLPDPGLEPDELVALQLAAAAVRLDQGSGVDALWALGGLGESEPLALSAELPADPALDPLFGAVSTRATVQFDYHGERRTFDPYRLGFQLGRWYVVGHDHDRGERRVFRLDRFESDVDVGRPQSFDIPESEQGPTEVLPERWELGTEPAVVATLRIDATHAPLASVRFDPADITQRPDGSIDVRVAVANQGAFRSLVLGYLEHAEVVDPPELRAAIVEWLEQVAAVADSRVEA